MITHISEKETQLVSMLRKTGEALDACTAERDALKERNALFFLDRLEDSALENLAKERAAILQAITDPENQPSQFGTVTLAMYEALVQERAALKWDNEQLRRCAEVQEVDRYAALNRKYVKERDTYQVEADRLAMECKVLRDALAEVLKAEMPTYHDCTDDGEMECHWCIAVKALVKKVPVEVSRDANPDEMNKLHGEDYGVDWTYKRSKS